jgi:DNA-3-methyladenine glycosylase II
MRRHRNRFRALVFSILGQQISGEAAAAIRARLVEYLKPEQISPQSIVRLTPEKLRSVGVSPQKAGYLLDLAERVASGTLRRSSPTCAMKTSSKHWFR